MDNDYIAIAFADAAAAIFAVLFSIGWSIFYTTLGSWLKIRLIHLKLLSTELPRRYGPVIVSHIIFSLIFVNPWLIFYIIGDSDNLPGPDYLWLIPTILYLWLPSVAIDCLLLRLLPKWQRLKWLKYNPPLKRLVFANLAASLVTFGTTFGSLWMVSLISNR